MISLNYTILIQLVMFVALVLILNKILYQPIFRIMDERRRLIDGNLEEAERLNREAQKALEEYEKALVEARQKAVKMVNEAKAKALEEQREALASVRREFEQTMAELKERLAKEEEEARKKLRQTVNVLAILIAEKILGRRLEERV